MQGDRITLIGSAFSPPHATSRKPLYGTPRPPPLAIRATAQAEVSVAEAPLGLAVMVVMPL